MFKLVLENLRDWVHLRSISSSSELTTKIGAATTKLSFGIVNSSIACLTYSSSATMATASWLPKSSSEMNLLEELVLTQLLLKVIGARRLHLFCFIYFGTLVDGLYIINYISPTLQLNKLNNTNALSCKRKQTYELNQRYLWHLRVGHINMR